MTTVVIENYQGNIALIMPTVAGVTVRVEGGSGSIKITAGEVPLTITAQGSSVKVPSSFREINGAFVSPRYASGVVSDSVTVSDFRGVVELIDE